MGKPWYPVPMENQENGPQEQKNALADWVQKAKGYSPLALEFLKIIILALVIVAPIRYFVFQPFIVSGESMLPNFENSDYLIVDELSYRFSAPQRGDVIVLDYPNDPAQHFIKRIIGLPGETVSIAGGVVTITNDSGKTVLHEEYIPANFRTDGNLKMQLGQDEYFVMGDNREHSFDSRSWGAVPAKDIVGKPIVRLFPFNAISGISRPSYQ